MKISAVKRYFISLLRQKYARYIILGLAILISLLFLMKGNVLAVLFIIAGLLLYIPMNEYSWLGLEISFSATIIVSSIYGAKLGLTAGLAPCLIGRFLSADLDSDILYYVPAHVVIAMIASYIPLQNLTTAGIILLVVYTGLYLILNHMPGGYDIDTLYTASSVSTSAVLNLLIILIVIPLLLGLGFS